MLVQGRHRLGPRAFAEAGADQLHAARRIGLGQHRADHVAALVGLGHEGVGGPSPRGRHRPPRPAGGRQPPRGLVGQDEGAVVAAADHHDAAGVARGGGGRVDGHDHAVQARGPRGAAPRQVLGAEEAAVGLDDDTVQLLSRQTRAAIEARQCPQEGGRQVAGVGAGAGAGQGHAGLGHQGLERPMRLGRGGDDKARVLAQPKPEAQHGQGLGGFRPGAELVGPGGVELRPAQGLRVFRRKGVGDRAVGPDQAPARGFPAGAIRRSAHGLEARRPLDHHLAHVVQGGTDQGLARIGQGVPGDPARPGEGLARAAPAQHQPGGPRAERRGELMDQRLGQGRAKQALLILRLQAHHDRRQRPHHLYV